MSAKRFLLLVAVGLLSACAFAKAAPHREKNPPESKAMVNIPLSEETRRLAAQCRRDPSDANREALKRQVRRDYDRYVAELRNKHKSNKNRRDQHRRTEMLINERDRRVEEIVNRLLTPRDSDEPGRRPKPPRKKR